MPVNIRKTFLNNSEQSHFDLSGETMQILWQVEFHPNAASLCKARSPPAQRRHQAHFIQKRRVEKIAERTDISGTLFD
jgi:hypothetical protein